LDPGRGYTEDDARLIIGRDHLLLASARPGGLTPDVGDDSATRRCAPTLARAEYSHEAGVRDLEAVDRPAVAQGHREGGARPRRG